MKPVDASKIVMTTENMGDYYSYSSGAFAPLTAVTTSGTVYELGDLSDNNSGDYNPVKWSVDGTEKASLAAAKTAVMTKLSGAATGKVEFDPNHDFGNTTTSTLTWKWDFSDDYGDGTDLTKKDRKDTILGDLIAAQIDTTETYYVVAKVGSTWTEVKYAFVKVNANSCDTNKAVVAYTGSTAPTVASAANVAVLTEFFGGQLTVKQIAKKTPTE